LIIQQICDWVKPTFVDLQIVIGESVVSESYHAEQDVIDEGNKLLFTVIYTVASEFCF